MMNTELQQHQPYNYHNRHTDASTHLTNDYRNTDLQLPLFIMNKEKQRARASEQASLRAKILAPFLVF